MCVYALERYKMHTFMYIYTYVEIRLMPGFSLAGQRRWATKRHHHPPHHHHPLLIFPVESKSKREWDFLYS